MLGDRRQGLFGAEFLHRNGGLGVHGVRHLLKRGAAVIHPEFAIGRGIPDVAGVAEDGVADAHGVEQPLHFAQVADGVAVETANEVDRLVRLALDLVHGAGLAVPEVLDDALDGVVIAGDVAADEGRGVRERHVEFVGNRALFLGILDEGVEVVTDHFRHTGGRDRDHLRLIQRISVGQAVDHVVQTAEHRGVFGHRRGHRRGRFLEVTRQMAAIIGDAALRTMHERQGLLKADRGKHRAERLTGLGRVDAQRLAGEVLFLIFRSLGPLTDAVDFGIGRRLFEVLPLGLQHVLVFGLAKQDGVINDVVRTLGHDVFFPRRSLAWLPAGSAGSSGSAPQLQGALVSFQIGELIAMSMSRAKIANPS